MAQISSPGVFIEELPSQTQITSSSSPSNMGIVGFTLRGPTDKATLVTSYQDFLEKFGGFTHSSFVAYQVQAFFLNGGTNAYVVRVVPSDAVAATCSIQSQTTDQVIEVGDGTIAAFTKTSTTSLLKDNGGVSPLVGSSVTFKWRYAATAKTADALKARNGTTSLVGDAATTKFEFRLNPTSIPAVESGLMVAVPGTVIINFLVAAAPKTYTIPAPVSGTVTVGTPDANVVALTFDHATGIGSITTTTAPDNASPITADFTPASATTSITDVAGVFAAGSNLTGSGSVGLADGAYSFTTVVGRKPHNKCPVLATYKINAWSALPVAKGKWGGDLKLTVTPHDLISSTVSAPTAFDVTVSMQSSPGVYADKEFFEGLSFSDPTSSAYFADVINELSNYLGISEPAGNEAPGELTGIVRSMILAGGDESASGKAIAATLINAPVMPRTLSITYTAADGTSKVITDDGQGNLIGDVAVTPAASVVYANGALSFSTSLTIKSGTVVTASYRSAPVETSHVETFGNTAKGYVAGSDGTFDSVHYGRNQLTEPTALSPSYKGMYALSKIEEIMQVVVPDFAGDPIVSNDMISYAELRATQPSGGDRFVLITPPKGSSAAQAADWLQYTLGQKSKWAAVYWPWIKVADPLAAPAQAGKVRALTIPPGGHVAGIYARVDQTRNVGKAPAGMVDGALRGLIGLERVVTQADRDLVVPKMINPLIDSTQTGKAVWGARTIAAEADWRYINARRLFMLLEKEVFNSTHWTVFENNGPGLWARIKSQLNAYLSGKFNEGYFAGSTASQAFFVVCDETNNTPTTIGQGQIITDIGVATNKPSEFVRFRFAQKSQ
jgi:phage tail sheath protein FI